MGKAQVLRGATGASLPTTVPALSPEVALQRLKVLLRMRTTRPGLEFDRVVNAVVRTNEPRAISALAEHVRRRKQLQKSPYVFSQLIQGLLRADRTMQATRLYKTMMMKKLSPPQEVYSSMIAHLSRTNKPELALLLFDHLLAQKMTPEHHVYNALIVAFGRLQKPKYIKRIISLMKKDGTEPTVATFTSSIVSFCHCGDYDSVLRAWAAMEKRGLEPDETAWSALIEATCRLRGAGAGEELLLRCPQPQVRAWNAVLSAFAREKNQFKVGSLFRQMTDLEHRPTLDTFCGLMRIVDPTEVLRLMDVYDVKPTARLFSILISRHAANSDTEQAKQAEQMMKERGLVHDADSTLALATAYARLGDVDKVKRLLQGRNDVLASNTLLHAFACRGDTVGMVRLFRDMLRRGLSLDAATFKLLITSHMRDGNNQAAELAFEELRSRKVRPNYGIIEAMLDLRGREADKLGIIDVYNLAIMSEIRSSSLRSKTVAMLKSLGFVDEAESLPH